MKEKITRAFSREWRDRAENTNSHIGQIEGVKDLCFDFFEAGWLHGQGEEEEIQVSDDDFETWWNMYQKKRGKEKCIKKWSKLSAGEKKACIAATPAYVTSTPDVAYRKDPYTYLNNKSWHDEIINGNTKRTAEQQRQQRLDEAARIIARYAEEDRGFM